MLNFKIRVGKYVIELKDKPKKKSDYVEYRNIHIEYSEGLDKYEIIADVNGVRQRLSLVRDLKSAEFYVDRLRSL